MITQKNGIIKFDYVNEEFVFKYIYQWQEVEKDEEKNILGKEIRYDESMNKESEYIHMLKPIPLENDNNDYIFVKKQKNNSETNYVRSDKPKDFSSYLSFLKKKNIITDIKNNKIKEHFSKQNQNSIYIIIGNVNA